MHGEWGRWRGCSCQPQHFPINSHSTSIEWVNMSATPNCRNGLQLSGEAWPQARPGPRLQATPWRHLGLMLHASLLMVLLAKGQAETNFNRLVAEATTRAEAAFRATHARWLAQSTNAEAAWMFGRACFDWADLATNDTQRAALAREGIAACRMSVRSEPKLAAGRYYLAMNLGQMARTKLLGALKLVDEIEREFQAARGLDPHLDFAGPDRGLGRLYLDAPGWPVSLGHQGTARHHLLRAAELEPEYPGNRLHLLEAALRWKDHKLVEQELEKFKSILPKARARLTGPEWALSWAEWDLRWAHAQEKAEHFRPRPKAK